MKTFSAVAKAVAISLVHGEHVLRAKRSRDQPWQFDCSFCGKIHSAKKSWKQKISSGQKSGGVRWRLNYMAQSNPVTYGSWEDVLTTPWCRGRFEVTSMKFSDKRESRRKISFLPWERQLKFCLAFLAAFADIFLLFSEHLSRETQHLEWPNSLKSFAKTKKKSSRRD